MTNYLFVKIKKTEIPDLNFLLLRSKQLFCFAYFPDDVKINVYLGE